MRKMAGLLFVFVWLCGTVAPAFAADKPDEKLMQYVRNAKKAGDKQTQVEQKAVKAGWPAPTVRAAIAAVYGAPNSAGAAATQAAAQPVNLPPSTPPASAFTAENNSGEKNSAKNPPIMPAENAAAKTASTAPHSGYEYRIGAGDVLAISVWKEPEASAPSVVVRPDGIISTPLTKEIHVAGLTPTEAENLITEKLVKVIQEPNVTVVVTGMNSKKVYAVGAVKREGPIQYTYSMTVMQAIAEAGGLTDYAKRGRIYVLRTENGKETRFPFPYDDILKGKHIELNIPLLPGDTLVVPH